MSDRFSPSSLPDGARELVAFLRFLRKRAPWILGAALLLGAVTFAFVATRPEVYETSALLTVGVGAEPRPGQFTAPVLSADGYLRLLASRAVQARTHQTLEQAKQLPEGSPQELDLEAKVLATRRGELGNTAMLELTARAADGETAAALANTWARTLIATDLSEVRRAALKDAVANLQGEILKTRDKLHRDHDKLAALETQLAGMSPVTVLRSRLTEAQWLAESARAEPGKPSLGAIEGQQLNPVYSQLSEEANSTRVEIATLGPQLAEQEASLALATDLLGRLEAGAEGDAELWKGAEQALAGNANIALPVLGGVQVSSPAIVPRHPRIERPWGKAALAALGGVILSVLVAALAELAREVPVLSQPSEGPRRAPAA
ncbi:MAG TPA: hypothetical protein PK413_02200 [Thermoanaerobaculia bacterium]|nr:hypothetical protein [Thermoanaerobaculia bacterium]